MTTIFGKYLCNILILGVCLFQGNHIGYTTDNNLNAETSQNPHKRGFNSTVSASIIPDPRPARVFPNARTDFDDKGDIIDSIEIPVELVQYIFQLARNDDVLSVCHQWLRIAAPDLPDNWAQLKASQFNPQKPLACAFTPYRPINGCNILKRGLNHHTLLDHVPLRMWFLRCGQLEFYDITSGLNIANTNIHTLTNLGRGVKDFDHEQMYKIPSTIRRIIKPGSNSLLMNNIEFAEPSNIKTIDLITNISRSDLETFKNYTKFLRQFKNLKELYIDYDLTTDQCIQLLGPLTSLSNLDFSIIDPENYDFLNLFQNLRILCMTIKTINDDPINISLDKALPLKFLKVRQDTTRAMAMKILSLPENLKGLSLVGNNIIDVNNQKLNRFVYLKNANFEGNENFIKTSLENGLLSLNFDRVFDRKNLINLTKMVSLSKSLKILSLPINDIKVTGMQALNQLIVNKQLTTLKLDMTYLSNSTLSIIEPLFTSLSTCSIKNIELYARYVQQKSNTRCNGNQIFLNGLIKILQNPNLMFFILNYCHKYPYESNPYPFNTESGINSYVRNFRLQNSINPRINICINEKI